MLSARKLHLLAGLKVDGIDLRQRELDFYMTRFIAIAGVSSITTGLSYVGLIKIKIPEEKQVGSEMHFHGSWEVKAFYIFSALTISLSMFNLFLTSFIVVNAQGLSLRGPPGSVAKCVEICKENWLTVRVTLVSSLLSIFGSAISIVWMKHDWQLCELEDHAPPPGLPPSAPPSAALKALTEEPVPDGPENEPTCVLSAHIISAFIATAIFVTMFALMARQVRRIADYLQIPSQHLVTGDLTVATQVRENLDIVNEGEERIHAAR